MTADRACHNCGEPLAKKPTESRFNYARRIFCGRSCFKGRPSVQYEDLAWLLEQGVEAHEALARCGIVSATAAYQWAQRHDDADMLRRIRHLYNAEAAKRHRNQRARRKAAA